MARDGEVERIELFCLPSALLTPQMYGSGNRTRHRFEMGSNSQPRVLQHSALSTDCTIGVPPQLARDGTKAKAVNK